MNARFRRTENGLTLVGLTLSYIPVKGYDILEHGDKVSRIHLVTLSSDDHL